MVYKSWPSMKIWWNLYWKIRISLVHDSVYYSNRAQSAIQLLLIWPTPVILWQICVNHFYALHILSAALQQYIWNGKIEMKNAITMCMHPCDIIKMWEKKSSSLSVHWLLYIGKTLISQSNVLWSRRSE